jgi:outer membrane protein TolC
MQLFGRSVFEQQDETAGSNRGQAGKRLRALAAVMLTLTTGVPSGFAQQAATPAPSQDKTLADLPGAPTPTYTEPADMRPSARDFSKPAAGLKDLPWKAYMPTTVAKASFNNSVRLSDLLKDGKLYLSLSDAIAIALENNYDLAIARYDLDIADTDILRSKAGAALLGVPTGLITGTQGSASTTLTSGGGPGGTSGGSGGSAAGASGLSLNTNGAGPAPEQLDPAVTAAIQLERAESPQTSAFVPRSFNNTDSYNFTYNQGFVTGTNLNVAFNNSRITSTSPFGLYSPELSSSFKATVTQHLLQGAGIWVNKRFMYQALNDRRIANSAFRQQILYTVNQVENIYWALVGAYEDVQAKQRALDQSTKLASDNRKQLDIGTLAPLDVVSSDSAVATDKQALINSQSTLYYQQLIIKQAIARNLGDPALIAAPVIPTDRVNLDPLPEEKQTPEELTQQAFQARPELEQAVLTLKNDEITLKGAKNSLLPTLDAYAFYGASSVAGDQNPNCINIFDPTAPCSKISPTGYGDALSNLGNSSSPDKGVGFNVQIPIRNRVAQSIQARSQIEYRQAQLRLEQLYTQIRMQVVNAQYALTNDRALVQAAEAGEQFNQQSLDAEVKKLRLGASTTANVLLQERNVATAENNLISARAAYARDRAGLYQTLASTLQHYGIDLGDAATGVVKAAPVIPGLEPAKPAKEPTTAPPATAAPQTN